MNKYFLTFTFVCALLICSCGDDKSGSNNDDTCFYEFEKTNAINFKWTAFKTSERLAVAGTFNEIIVSGGDKSTKLPEVLNTIKFTILTNSVYTTVKERDEKLVASFFGTMLGTDIIMGQVSGVEGDNEKGKISFYITMNEIEKEVTFAYVVTDNVVKINGEIDLKNWNGNDALTMLNNVCSDLHKGTDSLSVLWPNIDLDIEVALSKRCH